MNDGVASVDVAVESVECGVVIIAVVVEVDVVMEAAAPVVVRVLIKDEVMVEDAELDALEGEARGIWRLLQIPPTTVAAAMESVSLFSC